VAEIFIAVSGGLGNQLFQAAFGVAVEAVFGGQVRYLSNNAGKDIYGRQYLLARFSGLGEKAAPVTGTGGSPTYGEQGVDQASLGILLSEHPRVALDGYWQSERFFFGQDRAIADALRLDPDPGLAERGAALRSANTIGMHVRRSEYGHHGLAVADYYRTAVAQIRREVGPLPVVCFSDEPHFCDFVFRDIADFRVMRSNSEDPLDDFYLLSCCRHFVIANSSFSWWAAWLGAGPFSIVYAPLPWCVFDLTLNPVPPRWRGFENAVRTP
jgi:hypothetical protein